MRYTLSLVATRALMVAVASWVSFAFAQTNLGGVLQAGGRQITAEEFKRDVVGRVLTIDTTTHIPTAGAGMTGGTMELVYLSAGGVRGAGQSSPGGGSRGGGASFAVEGSWLIDERDRICTSMRLGGVVLAPRCQHWYVQGKQYFLSDSDSDRSARISSTYTIRQ